MVLSEKLLEVTVIIETTLNNISNYHDTCLNHINIRDKATMTTKFKQMNELHT